MSGAIPSVGLGMLTEAPQILLQDVEATLRLASQVEDAARDVARNLGDRYAIVRNLNAGVREEDIWTVLSSYWQAVLPYYEAKLDVEEHALALALALGKLERNLIAGLYDFQAATRPHEPLVRQLLFLLSSFTRIEDARLFMLQNILTQLLSNLVSPISRHAEHQAVADHFLDLYLSGEREADVVIRLLDSQDASVNTATLHLISNLTRGSQIRIEKLLHPSGIAWLSRVISQLDVFHASSSETASAAADRRFELATALLTSYIPLNLHSRLFASLASPDEPISPSQTTYLKIVDSYIHSHAEDDDSAEQGAINNRFLLPTFHLLSAYTITSIQYSPDDARLPKVFEALHLVCEILCAIGLRAQARADQRGEAGRSAETLSSGQMLSTGIAELAPEGGDESMVAEMRDAEKGVGVVQPIIESLQQLEAFLPRTNPRTARAAGTPTGVPDTASALSADQIRPIASLKRILVQLLGILSFSHPGVGDQVRRHGGVQLILGMTEVDENNPYLREHALFAVRNLMQNNPENQAVIAQMDPVGVLSDTGEVLPVPDSMRRRRDAAEESGANGHIA